MKSPLTIFIAALLLIATYHAISQGNLNPPVGPPLPTMKALDQVEPRIPVNTTNTPGDDDALYKIREPGSYYLTGNVRVTTLLNGIEIAASNVTLDLMGHELRGELRGDGSLSGVLVTGERRNISIRNGIIPDWSLDGVGLFGTSTNAILSDLRVSNCGRSGIIFQTGLVKGCSSSDNGQLGIGGAELSSNIADCYAMGNRYRGIVAANVTACTAQGNGATGIVGRTVSDCYSGFNEEDGIEGDMVSNCTALVNDRDGINTGLSGGTIRGCTASGNGRDGINAERSEGTTISGCTARNNNGAGIKVSGTCQIVGNTCYNNDAAGIHGTGINCVIRDNMATLNTNGIRVTAIGGRNLIIGNTVRSSPPFNYDIASGNRVGNLVSPTPSGKIQSNGTLSTGFGTPDPWANLNY